MEYRGESRGRGRVGKGGRESKGRGWEREIEGR